MYYYHEDDPETISKSFIPSLHYYGVYGMFINRLPSTYLNESNYASCSRYTDVPVSTSCYVLFFLL